LRHPSFYCDAPRNVGIADCCACTSIDQKAVKPATILMKLRRRIAFPKA